MRRPSPPRTRRVAARIGEYVTTWRKLYGLTADQVCQRAGISRPTLRKIESGDPSVSFESLLNVLRALGQMDKLADALDPYDTDFGRARADQNLPERVRR